MLRLNVANELHPKKRITVGNLGTTSKRPPLPIGQDTNHKGVTTGEVFSAKSPNVSVSQTASVHTGEDTSMTSTPRMEYPVMKRPTRLTKTSELHVEDEEEPEEFDLENEEENMKQ